MFKNKKNCLRPKLLWYSPIIMVHLPPAEAHHMQSTFHSIHQTMLPNRASNTQKSSTVSIIFHSYSLWIYVTLQLETAMAFTGIQIKWKHWKKKWSHFAPKSLVTGGTEIQQRILCNNWRIFKLIWFKSRTTISQYVQTRFSMKLAFSKFLSKIKGNFWLSAVSMILALY